MVIVMTSKNKICISLNNIHRVVVKFGVGANGVFKGKNDKSPHFSYQKTDDIYDLISPLLAEENILCLPYVLEEKESIVPTATGQMIRTKVRVEYTFTHVEDGSSVKICAVGEETDTGGKSSSKAMTAAHKAALKQMFLIPKRGSDGTHQPPQPQSTNVRTVQPEKQQQQNIRTVHSEVEERHKSKVITAGQISWIESQVTVIGETVESVLSHFKINNLSELTADNYEKLRKRVVALREMEQSKPAQ